ncbi:DUF3141 domain-containing protein [Rhodoblastus sp. 17X3]|uniref:DUF3141 domain-containing protein n=1 Tax=Rhodoblastus sp. 17X3 TaxID=3047026 RepID=UPI0024B7AA24|nr:DUF3141 domain-containing protein [Rhodoblastus sp. 17X3]MDI9849679.1 DUF3141 domain-containing protein [Rhodoblastus sp. 17X3]
MSTAVAAAETVLAHRKPVAENNPFVAMERINSAWMTTWLNSVVVMRNAMTEAFFLNAYASPWLQAVVGLGGEQGADSRRAARDLNGAAAAAKLREKLEHRFEAGGLEEAFLRALIYVRLPEGSIDERGLNMLKIIRESHFKDIFREQLQLVALDPERAIAALPKLAPAGSPEAVKALDALQLMPDARGAPPEEGQRRLAQVEQLLGPKASKAKALEGRS